MWLSPPISADFKQLDFGGKNLQVLEQLANRCDFPHLLFSGPPGCGKTQRIRTFLTAHFKQALPLKTSWLRILPESKAKPEPEPEPQPETKGKGNKKAKKKVAKVAEIKEPNKKKNKTCPETIQVLTSSRHTEIQASDYEGLVQEAVIKNALSTLISTYNVSTMFEERDDNPRYKVLVIYHAEALTLETQQSMLQLVEKNIGTLRVIFETSGYNRWIEPLQSRCMMIRIAPPTSTEMIQILRGEMKRHKIETLDSKLLDQIVHVSHGNIHIARTCLQRTVQPETALKPKLDGLNVPMYIQSCRQIVDLLLKHEPQIYHISLIIMHCKNLLENGYSSTLILLTMYRQLCRLLRLSPKTCYRILRLWKHFFIYFGDNRIPFVELHWLFQKLQEMIEQGES